MSGTSMAAASVAGLAALLFGAFPKATPDQVESAIVTRASSCPVKTRRGRARHPERAGWALERLEKALK